MAHPADQALMRAISGVIHQLKAEGWTSQELADRLGVAQSTISRWENEARAPALDLLPRLDALAGHSRGYILRRAGYVEDKVDIIDVIASDPNLDKRGKRLMTGLYAELSKRPASTAKSRENEPIDDMKASH
jgi:transcriptional regulator with XRE-family HTH domain